MTYPITYEEDFLIREIGSIATKADIAITELIANGHDAGASEVRIVFPEETGGLLSVEDNGTGLTDQQFSDRWLKLRYDRRKHQSKFVEVPDGNEVTNKRLAFGRNGIGRHAGLCFNNMYSVETWRDGKVNKYDLKISSGAQPILVVNQECGAKSGHGTAVRVVVERNLISVDSLKDIISARFLFNPEFKVYINSERVTLSSHPGIIKVSEAVPFGNVKIKMTLVDSTSVSRTAGQHGIAFWLGGRLLGNPSWSINGEQVLDGRRSFAKRHTLIVESDGLLDYIDADWSGFKSDFSALPLVTEKISFFVKNCYLELSNKEIEYTKRTLIDKNKDDINNLPKLARKELYQFIDQILLESPDVKIEFLELAFSAALNLEKSRAGIFLLYKLSNIEADDIEALDAFLDEWNVTDAMSILAEIDSRIKLIEAIDRLSGDHTVSELHTLHPLLEKARWVFGPEFDTPEYASNRGLRKTMEIVFGKKYKVEDFNNSAKRPDIVVGQDSTISALGLEEFEGNIKKTKRVLLIELKKGGFEINRADVDQAKGYVEDIWFAGVGSSQPFIKAYVVGDSINSRTSTYQEVGATKEDKCGEIHAVTFSELVRTAEARLFSLREKLEGRYQELDEDVLLAELIANPKQIEINEVNAQC